jgi:23S rRNA (adenine2030-N6)-methyltransferase
LNYRHGFHAGNHLDVFKHAALTLILDRLLEKPQPFAVLDSHAGVGVYDLAAEAPQRTREFDGGAGRVFGRELVAVPRYAALLAELNAGGALATYPGSPEIVRRMLRRDDRLICCELHPEEFAALKARYRSDRRVAVHHRDGYEAVRALLPPRERRGLVLIDPPYEAPDEAERLARALTEGLARWSTGTFMAWYPIKDRRIGDLLAETAKAAGFPKCLQAEFLPYAEDGERLAGGGILVCNAPWKLDERLEALVAELAGLLGDGTGRRAVAWQTAP